MSAIDTRDYKRDSIFQMAEIRLEGAITSQRVKIRNLSDKGMLVEGEVLASSGQRVIVTIKKIGQVGGVVAWTQSARIGISFDEPIESKLARVSLIGEMPEAPRYARPAVAPRESGRWTARKV